MSELETQRDIQSSFDIAARFYKWRVNYPPSIFEKACRRLRLDHSSAVLDICCGAGELASGFAERVGRVVGVDFSERMLALAPPHDRIEYLHHDINGDPPLPDALRDAAFDCFAIGRAIHWIDGDKLALAADRNLKPDGSILICGSGFQKDTAWVPAFQELKERYSRQEEKKDHTGVAKLEQIGFAPHQEIIVRGEIRLSVDDLARHAHSFARAAELISRNARRFQSELRQAMAPYLRDGRLDGKVVAWMYAFRRQ